MARCKGTTKSGSRCRLAAQPGSDYCHLHAHNAATGGSGEEGASGTSRPGDLVPLIVAGAMIAGFFLIIRSLERLIRRF